MNKINLTTVGKLLDLLTQSFQLFYLISLV